MKSTSVAFLAGAVVATLTLQCWGFIVPQAAGFAATGSRLSSQTSSQLFVGFGKQAVEEMDPKRKANLFQKMLRDLQIEGVPLLGCDAKQAETFMAATYTTMAEMSSSPEASKSCLVLENLPVGAIAGFVDDFTTLKLQPRLMQHLPELERFTVEVVGKGVGPALLVDARELTPEEIEAQKQREESEGKVSEASATAAIKAFVERMVIQSSEGGTCPYTQTVEMAPGGLEAKGVNPAQIGYRYGGKADALHALASFWTAVCELQSTDEKDLSTTVLSLPCIGAGTDQAAHDRFVTVVEIISRALCLFRGDSLFGLVHFHPAYDRTAVFPDTSAAYGHLPPRGWLRSMLKMNGNTAEADDFTDEQLNLSDYQRRAPHTAINILRVSQISAATGAKSIVDLDIGDGKTEKASGITTYSRNAIKLAHIGKDALEAGLQKEMTITWS